MRWIGLPNGTNPVKAEIERHTNDSNQYFMAFVHLYVFIFTIFPCALIQMGKISKTHIVYFSDKL